MDVELQIKKHLAIDVQPTVSIIDEYCDQYRDLFKQVINHESFNYLGLEIVSPISRNSLPEIAKVVRIKYPRSPHF